MTSSFCGLFSLFAMKSEWSFSRLFSGHPRWSKKPIMPKRRKNVMLAHIHGSVLCDIETLHNYRGERCTKAIVDRMTRRGNLQAPQVFLLHIHNRDRAELPELCGRRRC
jgi:hypothetical protein